METETGHVPEARATHGGARAIFTGLALGPLLFAGGAWYATAGGEAPLAPQELLGWIAWGTVSLGGLVTWLLFRRKAVAPMTRWSRHERAARGFTAARLQTYLVVAWAGAESVGLAGGIGFLFTGSVAMLAVALAAAVLCFGLTSPREAWFRTLEREARAAGAR